MTVSILVPVLNEADIVGEALRTLEKTLESLKEVKWQVILIDGGSQDSSADIVRNLKNPDWILLEEKFPQPSVGRAIERGLREARGETCLILPVDVVLPLRSLKHWLLELTKNPEITGGFAKKYLPENLVLKVSAWLQNRFRSGLMRNLVWTNAIFFPRHAVSIPTVGFLEDVILSDQLRDHESWRFISSKVLVSSRRYYPRRSFFRTTLNLFIVGCYRFRLAGPLRLKQLYFSFR